MRILSLVSIHWTSAAGTLPHQFHHISPSTHPRRTSFQPLEARFSASGQYKARRFLKGRSKADVQDVMESVEKPDLRCGQMA